MPICDMRVYLRVPAPRNSIHFHFHVVYTEPRASVDASYAGHLRGINRIAHQDAVRTYLRAQRVRAGTRVRYHFINHTEDRSQSAAAPRGTLGMRIKQRQYDLPGRYARNTEES